MTEFTKKLLDFLLKGHLITQIQIDELSKEAETKPIEVVLREKEILNDSQLGQIIADLKNWRYVDLDRVLIDKTALNLIPEDFAKAQNVICFGKEDEKIKIALGNPDDTVLIHLLQKTLNAPLMVYYSTPAVIQKSLYSYQKELQSTFERLIQEHLKEAAFSDTQDSAVVKIVDLVLLDGYKKKASDIHVEPQYDHTLVRFRLDGVMHDIINIPKNIHDSIITRIKVLSQLRTDEHQAPQDGKFEYFFENEPVDIRVSILPTTNGENLVMRLLSEKSRRFSLEDLGFSERDYGILRENIKKPWGMILATGPTGAGKTTTLYAILKILNKREVNIATIEDPVEYTMDNVTQIQVNPRANLTFAAGLRSLVRQDPNIIMVGEIRDEETASIAVNSAMTGHLVLSSIHTNDAATTLPRLLDMGIQSFLVASTVNVALAQRLLRGICKNCITSFETTPEELKKRVPEEIVEKIFQGKDKLVLYKGKGCDVCHQTGYLGRIGVFEVLEINDEIRELIIKNAAADTIKNQAIKNGMTTMFDDALQKVLSGRTTVEEMLRVVKL
ncbi:MAG: GspE/PulE family protein [Candidatus Gracilibacteria bacterium]|jgi:type IV pilus assembly protein PilB